MSGKDKAVIYERRQLREIKALDRFCENCGHHERYHDESGYCSAAHKKIACDCRTPVDHTGKINCLDCGCPRTAHARSSGRCTWCSCLAMRVPGALFDQAQAQRTSGATPGE